MRTLLLTLCLWSTLSAAGEFPLVVDPVVNATPPGAKVTAGYFTLVNETDAEINITGAYSPTIAKVEIHQSLVKDDVAIMELQDSVSIQPGATVEFVHGGYHLMLMELTEPLEPGQSVDIILITSAGDMLIEMPVQKIGMAMRGKEGSHASEQAHSDDTTQSESAESESKAEHNQQKKMEGDEQVSSK